MLDSIYASYVAVSTHIEPVFTTIATNYHTVTQYTGAYADHIGCLIDQLPLFSPVAGFIEYLFSSTRVQLCHVQWPQ